MGANITGKCHSNSCFRVLCVKCGVKFAHLPPTEGAHKLRCSLPLVPAVRGAPRYGPPARTSGTGTGAPRLTMSWYTVRTRTVCAVASIPQGVGRSIRPPSCETAHRRCSSGSPKLFRRRLVRDKDGDGSLRHPPRTWRYHYARHFLCGWRSAIRSGTGAVWTDGADAGARSRFPVDYLNFSEISEVRGLRKRMPFGSSFHHEATTKIQQILVAAQLPCATQ